MRALKRLVARVLNFAMRRTLDERLREEMDQHLECQTQDNLHAGMSPAEARRQAILKLGAVEAIREQYHAEEGLPSLENLLQDMQYALRILRKSPGFSIAAVSTLALGVGANLIVFLVLYGVLLKPLPHKDGDRLVSVARDSVKAVLGV